MAETETLICIFSGASKETIEHLENHLEGTKPIRISPSKLLGNIWDEATQNLNLAEPAVFLPGLIDSSDGFPAHFRRFVQVGPQKEDKVRNLFELAFEKGYSRAIFVEDFTPIIETKIISEANQKLAECDMVLGPKMDGSLYLWGMNLEAFSTVHFFHSGMPEVVVELISQCNETGLGFALLPSLDPEDSWAKFGKSFER